MTVPADAQSGDYVAGISALIPVGKSESASAPVGNKASLQVSLQTRRVIAVQVDVPGSAAPNWAISGVSAVPNSRGMDLAIAISAAEGKFAKGSGTIDIPSAGFKRAFAVDLFVPGTSIAYPIEKWQTAPKAGNYAAHVLIHYGEAEALTAEWNGNVTVADKTLESLKDQYVAPVAVTSSKTPWVIYGLIGGLVLIVLIMGLALLRRRRPVAR